MLFKFCSRATLLILIPILLGYQHHLPTWVKPVPSALGLRTPSKYNHTWSTNTCRAFYVKQIDYVTIDITTHGKEHVTMLDIFGAKFWCQTPPMNRSLHKEEGDDSFSNSWNLYSWHTFTCASIHSTAETFLRREHRVTGLLLVQV